MFKLKSKKRDSGKRKKRPSLIKETASSAAAKIVPVILALSVLAALLAMFGVSLVNLPYFKVNVFEIEGQEGLVSLKGEDFLKNYQGRNIFSVDVKAIADRVYAKYPDAKDIRVRRVLPDRLLLAVTLRKPVALVSDGRYYPVDKDGVVLPNADASSWQKIPVITGLDLNAGDKVGRRCDAKGLKVALDLLLAMQRSMFLSEYTVTSIDVSDPRNISFFLEDGLEVKIGRENFRERLKTLLQTLRNPKLIVSRIKYIDLRFKDVVMGQK